MKRISTALVAATVATGLALTPAGAETAAPQPETGVTATTNGAAEGQPTGEDKTGTDKADSQNPGDKKPSKPAKNSGSSTGKLVAAATGITSAVLTTAIIVFSNPAGINKAVDLLNANFGLGLPHFTLF
ncbi:hypothetical protein V6D40_07930 [Corynebacterium sp. Q4381]|uniref:hypothetical protein n=1 Tax=Corynebacterium sp. Marseille-Q4381 TaxID=3121597 RepID=UPI002FE57911